MCDQNSAVQAHKILFLVLSWALMYLLTAVHLCYPANNLLVLIFSS